MKKLYLALFTFLCFFITENVSANTINSIDMSIYLNEEGNAHITEVWNVDGSDGTEWYKVMNNLGNSKLTNFEVSMDGKALESKSWNVNESLEQKKGYYGINYTDSGLELCFGKYDYNPHTFTLNYDLSNYVINTGDTQTLYWTLIGSLSGVTFRDFSVVLSSYYEFPDTLDVWGYGYKGYAYVKDGKIYMSNEEETAMGNSYAVLLAKFPGGTFKTDNFKAGYETFDDVFNAAEEGTYQYDYGEGSTAGDILATIFSILVSIVIPFVIVLVAVIAAYNSGYGYKNNKKINEKDINMFRDIPCNKDIYYANALLSLNNMGYKASNIFGAIILKWIKEEKIGFKNETKGIFNKETSTIDLTMNPTFENETEKRLFDMMHEASKDGFLEAKELEKWCRSHYSKFLNLFEGITTNEISKLKGAGHIYKRKDKTECKKKNVMDDKIYEDSVQLYGLKKFLKEFSRMDEKQPIEVHLWDEYLMFAYLFGMADQVAKKFKNLYPEVVEQMEQNNFDYNTFVFVNSLSSSSVHAASSARAAAQSYSSGGGGFSSGGGGGGSFGGGGGGSR